MYLIVNRTKGWLALAASVLLSVSTVSAQVPPNVESALTALGSSDLRVRQSAFYSLLKPFGNEAGAVRLSIEDLLTAYPDSREQLATVLIGALERDVAYRKTMEQSGQQRSESFTDYWQTSWLRSHPYAILDPFKLCSGG
jgi:hypothetical protein